MKTKEEFLRESFGEIEISQIISKYPSSIQRPSIYRAMEEYASQQTAELQKELSDFKSLVKQMREDQKRNPLFNHDTTIEVDNYLQE